MRASYVLIPAAAAILVLVLLYLRYGPSRYRPKERSAWARLVCAPELSEEEFTSLYARAIEEGLGNAQVTINGPRELTVRIAGRESSYKVWLENVWRECSQYPEKRGEICHRYIGSFIERVGPGSGDSAAADVNMIVPVMQSTEWLNNLPLQADGSKPVVAEHLAADIWILYACQAGDTISFLSEDDVFALNLTMSTMRAAAVRNLGRMLPRQLRIHGDGPTYMISIGGNYEASLLLLEKLWQGDAIKVNGEVVAAIPSRDMLIVTGTENLEGIPAIRRAVDEIYENEPYAISRTLLVHRDGRWQLLDPSIDNP